ncbi:hypothetical protein D6D02_09260 [Aureobasidium pullulans]|uniref:Uncharacterized protein n=1 Tax=Aureobasidium pullulans TaxID=5580 RepID=A0A4S9NM18_AURPU|nr:hypothetical protein D6D24_07695 [Aureobasidium pullulans]THX98998.1 hypothetical protein D6D02_09260 [Aureobasidium pullulans]THY56595.1 hypothetical protein D6C98_03745 [Aureobasidium pullulans]
MSTATSTSICPETSRRPSTTSSTTSRHRRSTVSLHSTPGLGLIRTISRDLVTGWHTTTALQKESSHTSTTSTSSQKAYKPRYAARDALKAFPFPTHHHNHNHSHSHTLEADAKKSFESNDSDRDIDIRTRQDSASPGSPIDCTKPLARVEDGLIPDHSFDTWSDAWDNAYERRVATMHKPAPTTSIVSSDSSAKPTRKHTRPPLTGRLSVTDAEVRDFVFAQSGEKKRGFESPEGFLIPRCDTRRGSEVPSLVSEVSSRSSALEDLEEGDEESDDELDVGVLGQVKGVDGEAKRWGKVFVRPAIDVVVDGVVTVV